MPHTIDARGLVCPEPVIRVKNALKDCNSISVIVDNETAYENIKRMASADCAVTREVRPDGIYLTISRISACNPDQSAGTAPDSNNQSSGPTVLMVSQDKMGKGDDALGDILIKSFFHTVSESDTVPDIIIFLNSGVKLAVEESEIISDLKDIERKGCRILSCGTCLNYFNIKDKMKAGSVSNMYDIKEIIFSAGRIISI